MSNKGGRVCLVPQVSGVGGMVSFQRKMASGLKAAGIAVSSQLDAADCQAVLVTGGTRQLVTLWQARRRGARIVQRLDGMNWLHRLRPTGLRHRLRAEYGNWLLAFIRSHLADAVVYQSDFARLWWEQAHGPTKTPSAVIHNGVDLSIYTPEGIRRQAEDAYRVLLVEGSLMGGYEMGLEVALNLVEGLNLRLKAAHSISIPPRPVELVVVGRVQDALIQDIRQRSTVSVIWMGQVIQDQIPEIDRSAHMLYSADIHPACPNSVIEALACGLPVLAFDTGALPELVDSSCGKVVPYGGDPWRLEPPDLPALMDAGMELLAGQEALRRGARQRAEEAFGLDQMVAKYLHVLLND